MDYAEKLKSSGDVVASRMLSTLSSNGLDSATKQSMMTAEIMRVFEAKGHPSLRGFACWYAEIGGWMLCKITEAGYFSGRPIEVKRDDWLTEVACLATHKSFESVMEQVRRPGAYRFFSTKRTIKSLYRRVLGHFDLLCKDLMITNSWDATSLRNNILKAADLAKDYVRLPKIQLQLTKDKAKSCDNFILSILRGKLTGHIPLKIEDTPSDEQYASQTLQDDNLVGLSSSVIIIKERLIGGLPPLEMISIVGMGGIGKSTLTRRVYEDPHIMLHFHVRAWITVSQEFRERDVFVELLKSIGPVPDEVYKEDKEQLAERLYRRLKGWRYFIVIDDIWTTEAWDHMKLCFPDDNTGSRIVLSTRITGVASYINTENPYFMDFLGPEDSWELLRRQVYGKEACPAELVNIGMQIAEKCQGLPLAIKVVAGHISNISRTRECWEDVAKRVGLPAEVNQMESLSNILSVSYNTLPDHLKACFLSMVVFPKNSVISVGKLIRLWIAMGFLPPVLPNSLEEATMEEVTMKCFEELIGRSLLIGKKKNFDGKVKLCGIHDLLWDLGMREAQKEGDCFFGNTSHFDTCDGMKNTMCLTHALLYFDQSVQSDCPFNSPGFKLLKVLDILNQSFDEFPYEITDLINLRYLALATCGNIPGTVSKLCFLQTLINIHEKAGPVLPKEIWLLACLRYLHVGTCTHLVEPPTTAFEESCISVLPNLQALFNLSAASCTKEVISKIPNLKQVGICEAGEADEEDADELFSSLSNLVYLHKLEIFKLCCKLEVQKPRRIPEWISFLPNIKQLTLIGSNLPWSEMKALAMLPNLEVLKLKRNAFTGQEWEMEEEEFLCLKFLLLESLELIFWKAKADNFPHLRRLVIRECIGLNGIPIGIGEIYTLELIDLEYCNLVTTDLAKEIQKGQKNLGNDKLDVRIGRTVPEIQLFDFVVAFVYMTMRLKMLWSKKGRTERKGKDAARKTEVLADDFTSSTFSEVVNEK